MGRLCEQSFLKGHKILNLILFYFTFCLAEEALFATRIIRSATNEPTLKGSVNRAMSGKSVVSNFEQQAMDYCMQYQHVSNNQWSS